MDDEQDSSGTCQQWNCYHIGMSLEIAAPKQSTKIKDEVEPEESSSEEEDEKKKGSAMEESVSLVENRRSTGSCTTRPVWAEQLERQNMVLQAELDEALTKLAESMHRQDELEAQYEAELHRRMLSERETMAIGLKPTLLAKELIKDPRNS